MSRKRSGTFLRDLLTITIVICGLVYLPACRARSGEATEAKVADASAAPGEEIPPVYKEAIELLSADLAGGLAGGYEIRTRDGRVATTNEAIAGKLGDYYYFMPKGAYSLPVAISLAITPELITDGGGERTAFRVSMEARRDLGNFVVDLTEGEDLSTRSFVIDPGVPSGSGAEGIVYDQVKMQRAMQEFSDEIVSNLATPPAGSLNLADPPPTEPINVEVNGLTVALGLSTVFLLLFVIPIVLYHVSTTILTDFVRAVGGSVGKFAVKIPLFFINRAPGGIRGKIVVTAIMVGGTVLIVRHLWKTLQAREDFQALMKLKQSLGR